MKNINKFSFVLRLLMSTLAILITSMAFALLENNLIDQLGKSIFFQLALFAVFLIIFTFSIFQFNKKKDEKALSDLVAIVLCIPIILISIISTINTSKVEAREKELYDRLVRIHTIEYSPPRPYIEEKTEYYQAFLLNSNYLLLSRDVLYSDKQVYFGKRKLWPCDDYRAVDNSMCIAYFEDPIQIPDAKVSSIPQDLQIGGSIKAYLRPEDDVFRSYKGSIQGKISTDKALLPINISIHDIPLSPDYNIIPVTSDGHLLGFIQKNSFEDIGVRIYSSLFDGLAASILINESLDPPITNYRDSERYQNWPNTVTTFVLTPHMSSLVETDSGFKRVFAKHHMIITYDYQYGWHLLYNYVHVHYLNEDSEIPLSNEAFSYYLDLQNLEYSDAPQTNEEGKELSSFTSWTGDHFNSLVLLDNIETNIYRRTLVDTYKETIICDEGTCQVNCYIYDTAVRTPIY